MSGDIGSTVIHAASASLLEVGYFVCVSSKIMECCMSLESKQRACACVFRALLRGADDFLAR